MRASWGRLLKVIRSYSGTINDKGKIHSPPRCIHLYCIKTMKLEHQKRKSYVCSVSRPSKTPISHKTSLALPCRSNELSDIIDTEEEILCYVSNLDHKKAAGPS